MRRFKYLLAFLGIACQALLPIALVSAAPVNLLQNPSVELGASVPTGWKTGNWGTNAASFTYENTGHSGNRSVKTTITTYSSGDAKWYSDAVSVTPGKRYTYSDYYQATVSTRVVAAYTNTAGSFNYAELGTAPAASAWTLYQSEITVPAEIATISIFHLIDGVGSLSLDDASLTEYSMVVINPAPSPLPGDTTNLIQNSSMETANGIAPLAWSSNKWGTLTAVFTYDTNGHTGSRSLKTAVSRYRNGDAKWYAEPVGVTGGTSYIYRDYYKSGVTTKVYATYIDSAGSYRYQQLDTVPASKSWTLYSTSFTVPAGTVKATVFHALVSNGSLSLDDVELVVAPPIGTNDKTIPNDSAELGTAEMPFGWNSGSWGTNVPVFDYVTTEGQTGSRSLKVTVANYQSGDAKWYFEPISTLVPGNQYRFTAWFKGSVIPHVVAMYLMSDGTERYAGLPNPLSIDTTVWTKYTDSFIVPRDAVAASVFLYINQNGWLQTDSYAITGYQPVGFNRPLVTLTFDDGHEDNYMTALPIMTRFGFKSTQCYATSFLEGAPQAVIDGALSFHNSGHEICSHSVSHPFLTSLDTTQLRYELQHSKDYLERLIGAPVRNFASPYGDYNAAINGMIDDIYQSHRTVDEGFNSKDNFDKFRLRVQNILVTTTTAQVQEWVGQAKADNTWLILLYHRVADNPGPYDSYVQTFTAQMQAIKDSGVTVKTYQDALIETATQM